MPIRTENHEILDVGAVELNGTVYEIVEPHGAVRDLEPNRPWRAVALARGDFIRGQTAARPVVFPAPFTFFPSVALRLQSFGRAVAVVRVTARDQLFRHRAIAIEPLGLKVRRVRTVDLRPLVPVESQPPQAIENPFDHVVRRPLDVRILDAQHEHPAQTTGEEPVEERGTRPADVQIPGGRGSKADARGWHRGNREVHLRAERFGGNLRLACQPHFTSARREQKVGGEAGIRTLDTGFSPYNGLANRRLQPLGHLTCGNRRSPVRSGPVRLGLKTGDVFSLPRRRRVRLASARRLFLSTFARGLLGALFLGTFGGLFGPLGAALLFRGLARAAAAATLGRFAGATGRFAASARFPCARATR